MGKNTKIFTKFLAVTLSVATILSVIPMQAFAEDVVNSDSEVATETDDLLIAKDKFEAPGESEILSEDEAKREEYTKHFRMNDGTVQAAQYDTPVHFKHNGKWADYDNTLVETDSLEEENDGKLIKNRDLINTFADFSVRFSKKTNGKKFVRFEKDGYDISWYYKDANKQNAKVIKNEDDGDKTTLENITSEVVYKNVYKDTDFQYIVNSEGVKENIILTDDNAPTKFIAEYKANGLTPVQIDDKTIELRNKYSEVIYVLSAPYMVDSALEVSYDVSLTLCDVESGRFTVTTTLDAEWVKNDNRSYPITVDPLLETSQKWEDSTSCHSAYISSSNPNSKYGRGGANYEGSLYVGQTNGRGMTRALIKTPNLPKLGVADKVVKAEVAILVRACYPELIINLHRVKSAWEEKSVCWNSNVQYDPAIADYQTVQYMETSTDTPAHTQVFEITEMAKGWYDGSYPNNGVLLRSDSETSTSQARAWMFSSGYTTYPQTRPVLLIQYRNMTGYEDIWSFTNVSAGRGGVASVNNYNGNLVFSQPITEDAGGNLMPVNLSLIYSSNDKGPDYAYTGTGFQTNYHIFVRYDPTTAENGYRYYLNDADGTHHWFRFEPGKDTGTDEDGLGLTFDKIPKGSDTNEKNACFRITDKNKNKMYFAENGDLIRILNTNGVSSTVSYEPTGTGNTRITKVIDGAGRAYVFGYDASIPSKCVSITDPSGRKTSLNNLNSSGNLTEITFADGKKVKIEYSGGLISAIYGIDGTKTAVAYDTTAQKRVKNIKWGTVDSSLESYSFVYKQNETSVNDDIKKQSYTYQFNDWGQTTGIVSNTDGTAQFFEFNPGNTTDSRANKLVSESKVQKSVTNYVANPGFTNNFTSYWTYIEDSTGAVVSTDSGKSNLTKSALKVEKPSSNTKRVNAVQTIKNLPGGTYTLSGYINTNGVALGGNGAALVAEVRQPGDGAAISSYYIEKTTKTNAWERRSVTFTVPDNGTVRVTLGLNGNAYGTVWFDDLQLEKGEIMSSCNLVENSALTNGTTKWSAQSVLSNCTDLNGYNKCIRINSNTRERFISAYQLIETVPGKKGDVFSVGGWVKADSAPTLNKRKDDDPRQPYFRLSLNFYDSSGRWIEDELVDINPDVKTWQFVSLKAIAPVDYHKVSVEFVYSFNVNQMYATGAFCYKEEYGQTYTYDKDGNIISSVDLAKTNSQFAYADNLLSKSLNPSGSEFMYRYDANTNNLIIAQSTDGIRYKYSYDSKGNPTYATAEEMKFVTSVDTNTTYIVRNKYSTNALDSGGPNSTVHNYRCGDINPFQKWTLEATGETDVYYLKSNGKYMYVEGNSSADNAKFKMSATKGGGNEYKFKILYNDNGTFRILTKSSNYTKCVDGMPGAANDFKDATPISQYTYGGMDSGQHWFFFVDPMGQNKPYISTSAEYSASGNFATSATDQRGNKTSYSYDETKGTLNSVTDANNNKTEYKYDPNNNSLQSVTSGGMTNSYSYANDRLTNINVNGATRYQFNYDQFGRTTETKVGNGTDYRKLSALEYNSHSLLSKQFYGNNDYITFSYDSLDRITEKKYNGDSKQRVTYSYGSDGSIARTTDYFANTNTRFIYDLAGRVVSQREYYGTDKSGNQLKGYTNFTYADKTNYLTEMEHYSPLGTQKVTYEYGDLAEGKMPDQVYKVRWNDTTKIMKVYDDLGRQGMRVFLTDGHTLYNRYKFVEVGDNRTTTLVKTMKNDAGVFEYEYDKLGNIISINDGTYSTSYEYDNLNQLVRTNDERVGKTYTYAYTNGNITECNEYAYTVGELGEVVDTKTWQYNDSTWSDLLTNYNGTEITYDTIGNPLTIGNKMLVWNGRQLQSITDGTDTITYKYNGDGQRISKTVNGVTTECFYNGEILAGQKTGDEKLVFMYDENGDAFGFVYNSLDYFYLKNAQNDVVAITDNKGAIIANYYYDSWGKLIEITGDKNIAELNPIRYRSYYYDSETGWYYLKTRYYSPEMCRFLNADGLAQTGQGMLDKNMFAYCGNNPILFSDPNGCNYEISFPAVGDGPVTITQSSDDTNDYCYTKTGDTYTVYVNPPLPKDKFLSEFGRITVNSIASSLDTAINAIISSMQPISTLSTAAPFIRAVGQLSKNVGMVSLALMGAQMIWDYARYGNNPKSFVVATTITVVSAALAIGLGALITVSGVGPTAALVIAIGGGCIISYVEDRTRKELLE